MTRAPEERQWAKRFFTWPHWRDCGDEDDCPVCGCDRWSPDHRSTHAKVEFTWNPKPNPKLAAEYARHGFAVPVTDSGPHWRMLWARMYECARAFNRETGWGTPWPSQPFDWKGSKGYLLTDDEGRAIGSAVVGLREYTDHPPEWVLAWVWIAPPYRRKGLMRKLWAFLTPIYPGIFPEPPFAPGMAAFVLQQEGMPDDIRRVALAHASRS